MGVAKVEEIPLLIKELGDGEYRIKVKNGDIIIFSKNSRYEKKEIKNILENEKAGI